jgi:hypothetical protein
VLALLASGLILAGCASSGSNDQQQPPPRYHPNSNQNPGYDGSG